jgi:hypothetical protein
MFSKRTIGEIGLLAWILILAGAGADVVKLRDWRH